MVHRNRIYDNAQRKFGGQHFHVFKHGKNGSRPSSSIHQEILKTSPNQTLHPIKRMTFNFLISFSFVYYFYSIILFKQLNFCIFLGRAKSSHRHTSQQGTPDGKSNNNKNLAIRKNCPQN